MAASCGVCASCLWNWGRVEWGGLQWGGVRVSGVEWSGVGLGGVGLERRGAIRRRGQMARDPPHLSTRGAAEPSSNPTDARRWCRSVQLPAYLVREGGAEYKTGEKLPQGAAEAVVLPHDAHQQGDKRLCQMMGIDGHYTINRVTNACTECEYRANQIKGSRPIASTAAPRARSVQQGKQYVSSSNT